MCYYYPMDLSNMGSQNQKWQREFEQLEARWLAYTATGQATLSQLKFWESVKDFQVKAGFITEKQKEAVLSILGAQKVFRDQNIENGLESK